MDGVLNIDFTMGRYSYLRKGTRVKFIQEGKGGWNTYELPSKLVGAFGPTVSLHHSYVTSEA